MENGGTARGAHRLGDASSQHLRRRRLRFGLGARLELERAAARALPRGPAVLGPTRAGQQIRHRVGAVLQHLSGREYYFILRIGRRDC